MEWGTVVVALLGISGTLLATFVTGRNQQTLTRELFEEQKIRESIAYARQIVEARRERLVKRYEDLVIAARRYVQEIDDAIGEVFADASDEANALMYDPDAKLMKNALQFWGDVSQGRTDFERSIALLEIEDGNQDVVDLCSALTQSARAVLEGLREIRGVGFPTYMQAAMGSDYIDLVKAVQTHVKELERTGELPLP